MYLVISAVTFILTIGALVDIIMRHDGRVKHMPKPVWVLLVIFLPLIGSIIWFLLGREHAGSTDHRPMVRVRNRVPDRTARTDTITSTAPRLRSTEEQLADLEREIEFHEKQARIERLQREVEGRRDQD